MLLLFWAPLFTIGCKKPSNSKENLPMDLAMRSDWNFYCNSARVILKDERYRREAKRSLFRVMVVRMDYNDSRVTDGFMMSLVHNYTTDHWCYDHWAQFFYNAAGYKSEAEFECEALREVLGTSNDYSPPSMWDLKPDSSDVELGNP